MAVSVGQRQGRAATHLDIVLQSVFDGGGVGSQGGAEIVNEHIRLIVVVAAVQLVGVVGIFIPASAIRQTNGCQQSRSICFVNAVQHFYMVGGTAVGCGFGELDNIRYPQVGKLHAFNGIAIGGFAIAQVAGIVGITGPDSVAQSVVDRLVIYTRRDIGVVPYAILCGIGEIVLVNVQRAGAGNIDGSLRYRSGQSNGAQTQAQSQHQAKGKELFQIFHFEFSFNIG